jgi:hypothetical protein
MFSFLDYRFKCKNPMNKGCANELIIGKCDRVAETQVSGKAVNGKNANDQKNLHSIELTIISKNRDIARMKIF